MASPSLVLKEVRLIEHFLVDFLGKSVLHWGLGSDTLFRALKLVARL